MSKLRNGIRLAATSLLTLGMPVAAQNAAAGRADLIRPVQVPADAVRVPCCRCLDGTQERININTGTAAWKVSTPGSTALQPVAAANNAAWTKLLPAGWVGAPGAPQAVGDYTFQLTIYVPPCIIPARVVISGRFLADNGAKAFLDSNQIASSGGTPNYGFLAGSVTAFTGTVGVGVHVLRFVVHNSSDVTGLTVLASVTRACPKELESGDIRYDTVAIDRNGRALPTDQ